IACFLLQLESLKEERETLSVQLAEMAASHSSDVEAKRLQAEALRKELMSVRSQLAQKQSAFASLSEEHEALAKEFEGYKVS
ncbi:unnamed protein product, partial [Cyprideis torosa]